MHASTPTATPAQPTGANPPTVNVAPASAALCGLELLSRVGRVLQDMNAGRAVTDAEVLQHETDCRRLSEACYERFEDTQLPADREEAVLWLARATEARKCLSPAFKQAREAQIQQAIAEGTGCFFLDSADAARARVAR